MTEPKSKETSPQWYKEITNLRGGLVSDIWLFFKYQLLSKTLMAIVVMPIFHFIVQGVISLSGRTNVSSGDFKGFVFSVGGVAFLVLAVIFVVFLLVTDVAAFAISEAARLSGRPVFSARILLWQALKSLPRFLHPATLILVVYVGLIVPLVGFGPEIPALSWVKIPNFVSDVIFKTPLYATAYSIAIFVFGVVAFFLAATVPAMFVENLAPAQAIRKSINFMRRHWKTTIAVLVLNFFVVVLFVILVVALLLIVSAIGTHLLPQTPTTVRFSMILSSLILVTGVSFLAFIVVPLQLRNFTRVYAVISGKNEREDRSEAAVRNEDRRALPRVIATTVVVFIGTIGFSALMSANFDQIFKQQNEIAVIAHRAGGELDAENSLEGLEKSIGIGAQWAEIDIQRTKDGAYIVNHDPTFNRVAGVSSKAQDLTLDEISKIRIKNNFTKSEPERKVATIEQMLDVATGKIGLFVELKGETADKKMVDDMAKLISERGLGDSVALITLDYELVNYIESTYPELSSGYLYYFSVGDMAELTGDYLIMEEGVASPDTVQMLQDKGKKVVVWTVNTPESMNKFADSEVDGIITDRPRELIQVKSQLAIRTDAERIIDKIFGE